MKLKDLLPACPNARLIGAKQTEITGISIDSRTTAPGNLFIALQGTTQDGMAFVPQALEAGAAALVVPIYNPFIKQPQIVCDQPQLLVAPLAAAYYRNPSNALWIAGVTGSKGKTTTCYLLHHLLSQIQGPCGLISTVEKIILDRKIPSQLTTHDAVANQKTLREMADRGCSSAVLEVSSHGLAQKRVDAIEFDLALFTNLYPDHLDYHRTIDLYAQEKAKLFDKAPIGIYNADSPWASFMQKGKKGITFGLENRADVMARSVVLNEKRACFTVDGELFQVPLMGRFNVYNVLGAIAAGLFLGVSLSRLSSIFAQVPPIPGRLEAVPNSLQIHVWIDYAHTGESLIQVLQALREVCRGRIIVVFGAGGGRDAARRSGMGAASNLADLAVVTLDNSRQEDPVKIAEQVLDGVADKNKTLVELDRKKAIYKAIELAQKGDAVLIAGKGHERVQIFAHQTVPFDDYKIAQEAILFQESLTIERL